MHRFTLFLSTLVVLSWSGVASATPQPGQSVSTSKPSLLKRKPGLLQRIRRARTNPPPKHFQLLQLQLDPAKLFTKGKFTYWNPHGKQRKTGQPIYQFKARRFARKTKGKLLAKKGEKYGSVGFVVRTKGAIPQAQHPGAVKAPIVRVRIVRRYIPVKVTGNMTKWIYLGGKPGKYFRPKNVGHWATMHLSKHKPIRVEKGRTIVSMSQGRSRSASSYQVSLPASVYKDYQKFSARGLKAMYSVRFRITGYHAKTWYPKKHWMPHPHGGYRTYTLIGAVGSTPSEPGKKK